MRRRHWLMLVAGLAIQAAAPAMAQDSLRHKFIEGAEYKVHSTQKITQLGNIGPQDIGTEATVAVDSHVVTGKPDEAGNVPIAHTIDAVHADFKLPGGVKLQFDSAKPEAKADNPLYEIILDILRKQTGLTLTRTVSADNKVLSVEGVKEGTQLQPDDLKVEYQQEIDSLPTEPVKPGDTWERTVQQNLGQGQYFVLQRRYEYQGMVDRFPTVKGGPKVAKITATDLSVKFEIRASGGLPLTVTKSDLKVDSSKHTLLFDPEAGRIVDSQASLHVKGDFVLSIMGMNLDGKLDLTLDARSEESK